MVYLTIPKGMVFKKALTSVKDFAGKQTEVMKDCFVDPNGKLPNIDFQSLVKEAFQDNKNRLTEISLPEGITLYRRSPPNTVERFLKYEPNRNGKEPAIETPEVVRGIDAQKDNPALRSRYGEFWNNHANLSPERKAEVLEKRDAQREDRRHSGDSPKAT